MNINPQDLWPLGYGGNDSRNDYHVFYLMPRTVCWLLLGRVETMERQEMFESCLILFLSNSDPALEE